jgi:proton-dependent oligopeptide transporter, POT family
VGTLLLLSTLNIFAEDNTNRYIFGWEMPSTWLQSVNPILIIIFAPIFAALWTKMADRAPSTPIKFAIALLGIGLSFLVMIIPGIMADNGDQAAVYWLLGVYLIQTWAELLLSPTGLSVTTRLAPEGMTSQLLALWFLATAVGDTIGGQLARLLEGIPLAQYFAITGGAAFVLGIVYLFLAPVISRMMRGVK